MTVAREAELPRTDDVVARCPACANIEAETFTNCQVCGRTGASRWWCQVCHKWLDARACPVCGGGVVVPPEQLLGVCAPGGTLAFTVGVRNPAKKPVTCTVTSLDAGVTITNARLAVPSGGSIDLRGSITLPPGPAGRRTFRLRFEAPVPSETVLVIEAVAPVPRIEFVPGAVVINTARPGHTTDASVTVRNTGNVALSAAVTCSAAWLTAEPRSVNLKPGESAPVRLRAKSKRTDFGSREARLVAASEGRTWALTVRNALPDPQLAAVPVSVGELKPGRPALTDVILRNTGAVRVECDLSTPHTWLQVLPKRVMLPPGRFKRVRVRASLTHAHDGPQRSEVVASSPAGVVLRVPVTATGKVPKPVLRAIRKQSVRDVIGPAVEHSFRIVNDGDGRLVCTATANEPWVRILTPELKAGPGKKRRLRYELNIPVLPRGEHTATIKLASNGGTAEVPVTVHVLDPNPVLEVVPGPDLGLISPELPLSAFVQVRNDGIGLLTVRAESENPQVRVSPAAANVPMGPPVRFTLTIPVAGLPGGDHEAAVRLTSNGGTGRAAVRFRLPVEELDVPALIDLGDCPAGRPTGGALKVRNDGPDPVTLRIKGQEQWVRPATDRFTIKPGEVLPVPFRVDLPHGVLGPVTGTIVIEGRAVRHTVAVRAHARKVELVVVPGVLNLGDMVPGEERTFTVEVKNAGDITADIPESHVRGALDVRVRRAAVRPGERVAVVGRVRLNTEAIGQQVRAVVPLTEDASVRCVARVVAPTVPKLLAAGAAAGGLLAGGGLSVAVGWWLGVPLALLGLATGAWLYWRETR